MTRKICRYFSLAVLLAPVLTHAQEIEVTSLVGFKISAGLTFRFGRARG